MKRCTACGLEFPATPEFFYRHSYGGLKESCKSCYREKMRATYLSSREQRMLQMKDWRANPKRGLMNKKLDISTAPLITDEQRSRSTKEKNEWRARNRESYRMSNRAVQGARRARIRRNICGRVDLSEILKKHGMICHICSGEICGRKELHFDHVVPLALGGAHTSSNLAPAHSWCNLSKGARP